MGPFAKTIRGLLALHEMGYEARQTDAADRLRDKVRDDGDKTSRQDVFALEASPASRRTRFGEKLPRNNQDCRSRHPGRARSLRQDRERFCFVAKSIVITGRCHS